MLFNSIDFLFFLPIVFLLYWFVFNKYLEIQNGFLLIAGYIFYGWWDWRFLLILVPLSFGNYGIGIILDKCENSEKKKKWLVAGLILDICVLAVFKYFDFFIDGFIQLISLLGYHLSRSTTQIVLPVGISFYVFLSMSYLLDIYRRKLAASKNIVQVFLSFSLFSIILAGPIQRPSSLLPQISKRRFFCRLNATDGLRQILWGLFTKAVIADKLCVYVDEIFKNIQNYSGSTLALGAVLFSIQIYADFSGYSNIAIGISKLFGFEIMRNFDFPYFAKNIADFWQRWHISLSTWFRDYVFLPLSYSLSRKLKAERFLFLRTDYAIYLMASIVIWPLIGLWHGAKWSFIIWGFLHCAFLIIYNFQKKPMRIISHKLGIKGGWLIKSIVVPFLTLFFVVIAWIFFRADRLQDAFSYLNGMFSKSFFSFPSVFPGLTIVFVGLFFFIEWIGRNHFHALAYICIDLKWYFRWGIYISIIFIIQMFGGDQNEFIYYRF